MSNLLNLAKTMQTVTQLDVAIRYVTINSVQVTQQNRTSSRLRVCSGSSHDIDRNPCGCNLGCDVILLDSLLRRNSGSYTPFQVSHVCNVILANSLGIIFQVALRITVDLIVIIVSIVDAVMGTCSPLERCLPKVWTLMIVLSSVTRLLRRVLTHCEALPLLLQM